ncbi:MAG: patatin-like phospholipase family protein [Ancrocorticia populi]|uniref:patatin-like phospholipase family protein n=2 Tax=Ancrocorticia populi TaxID=2175228 RepID=UPI003F922F95
MRLSLVLGSGGARGYAHIGVIEELKARGHEIVAISGCSIGALVGGLEAAGGLDDFTDWAKKLTQLQVLRMLDFTLGEAGFVKADRVIEEVNGFCRGARIEDLAIPFTAVASDITARREVWFQEGLLANAIRASIAIPGVITPVRMQGHLLVDGGVCNPVPMEPTLSVPSDATVAVSLAGGTPVVEPRWALANSDEVQTEGTIASWVSRGFEELMQSETVRSLQARIARGQGHGHGAHTAPADGASPVDGTAGSDVSSPAAPTITDLPGSADLIQRGRSDISTTELAQQTIGTMQAMIERYRAAANPAQVRITIPYTSGGTLDFHRANELIELGREMAGEAFDRAGI